MHDPAYIITLLIFRCSANISIFAYDADLIRKIDALTPQQVNTVLKKYLTYDKLVLVQAGDFEKASKKLADKTPATQAPAAAGSSKKN